MKKVIALRLLAPELAKHESLAEQHHCSSASLARAVYLRGLASYERAAVVPPAAHRMDNAAAVNHA